jgi:hypothetical protein
LRTCGLSICQSRPVVSEIGKSKGKEGEIFVTLEKFSKYVNVSKEKIFNIDNKFQNNFSHSPNTFPPSATPISANYYPTRINTSFNETLLLLVPGDVDRVLNQGPVCLIHREYLDLRFIVLLHKLVREVAQAQAQVQSLTDL